MDGPNVYVYVQNNSVNLNDPTGYCEIYCGPDVTAWLFGEMNIFSNWIRRVNRIIPDWAQDNAPWYRPDYIYVKSMQYAMAALVGPQLTYFPSTSFQSKSCPTEECQNTVTLFGTCIHTSEIGNFLFGYVARHFQLSWQQTSVGARLGNRGTYTQADKAAVKAGWDYVDKACIDSASLQIMNTAVPKECETCPETVKAGQNHVQLPRVTYGMFYRPFILTLPQNVTD